MLSSVKNSWKFAKLADNKNRLCQTLGDKRCEERKRISEEIRENENAKKVAVESVSKIAGIYNSKIYKLKEKLCKQF